MNAEETARIIVDQEDYPDIGAILDRLSNIDDSSEEVSGIIRTAFNCSWNLLDFSYFVGMLPVLQESQGLRDKLQRIFLHKRRLRREEKTFPAFMDSLDKKIRDGWLGEDINYLLNNADESDTEGLYADIRKNRFQRDAEVIRVLHENNGNIDATVTFFMDEKRVKERFDYRAEDNRETCYNFGINDGRVGFLRAGHPFMNILCEDLGVDQGMEAHARLNEVIERAFGGEVIYGWGRKVVEDVRSVFVGEVNLELRDGSTRMAVVKLTEDPEAYRNEVREYEYRGRIGIEHQANFAAVNLGDEDGGTRYRAVLMPYGGRLNSANILDVIRRAEARSKMTVNPEAMILLEKTRADLLFNINHKIATAHAFARRLDPATKKTDDDYLHRMQEFLDDTGRFLTDAKQYGQLQYTNLETAFGGVRGLVSGSLGFIARYLGDLPVLYYYDCVTKNFPVGSVTESEDGKRSVNERDLIYLPVIDGSWTIEQRVGIFTAAMLEEAEGIRGPQRRIPLVPHSISSNDRCSIRNCSGLFDVCNAALTSFFRKYDEKTRELFQSILWDYILNYGINVGEYNGVVDKKNRGPRAYILGLIEADIENGFQFVTDEVDKDRFAGRVRQIKEKLEHASANQTAERYFEIVDQYVSDMVLPVKSEGEDMRTALKGYVGGFREFVCGLEPRENVYLADDGYMCSIPDDIRGRGLRKQLTDNSPEVIERARHIEADAYVSMIFRAAMIANTVPYYVRGDAILTQQRMEYYQIEIGNMLEAVRVVNNQYLGKEGQRYLRTELPLDKMADLEKGLTKLVGILEHLNPGRMD